jgi:hypothetical protein
VTDDDGDDDDDSFTDILPGFVKRKKEQVCFESLWPISCLLWLSYCVKTG